jgi:hypothetical protein
MPRYVPKTYNNRRVLRIIIGTVITIALSAVILFLILFFIFEGYFIDGQLEIPLLTEEASPAAFLPPLE